MLRPSKHAHPDKTIISAALIILERLKARRVCDYEELRGLVRTRMSGTDVLFLPALNFLYLVGLVQYLPKTDSFEYLGNK